MTGYADERADIEGRWSSLWVTGSPASARTPTRYETVPFEPPTASAWAAIHILAGEADQSSLGDPGNNWFRHAGVVMVQLFVPSAPTLAFADWFLASGQWDDGGVWLDDVPWPYGPLSATRYADILADQAAAIFRAARVGNLLFGAPYISGRTEAGAPWYQVTVAVPFSRDDPF